MLNKSLVDIILIFATIFLFVFSSIIPMVIGNTIDDKVEDEYFENISYASYDEYENINFEKYREINKGEIIEDSKTYEIPISKKSTQILPLDGHMDSPWPMKCHDTHHTGLSPYSTADNPLDEMWKFRITGWMNSGIIIGDDDTLYFGSFDGYLHALNQYGTEKWRYKTGGWIWAAPAIDEDGTEKWSFYAYHCGISSSPIIGEDGTIYFGAMGPDTYGRIYAINPDGTEKWYYDTGYWITSDPAIGDDGTIYIGSGDDYLYAMNPNGTVKWRYKTGEEIKSAPAIGDDGTIYFDYLLFFI